RVDREASGVLDLLETADIDARHSFTSGRHQIVWGGGYRISRDEFRNTANIFVVEPPKETIGIGNVFAQDSISLRPDLKLTVGLKYEHSSYSGGEFLPSARIAWQVSERTLLWAAVSRAVRTPSRIDRDLVGAGITERAT